MPPGIDNTRMSTSMFADLNDGRLDTYKSSYRSVAFRTWKVGDARRRIDEKFAKRNTTLEPVKSEQNCQPDKSNSIKSHRVSRDLESIEVERESSAESHASKSQPCSPSPTKRPLKKQARLAQHEEETEEMSHNEKVNGDCYSSTEYVQFATARNAYENVNLDATNSQFQRQSLLLNRSMDALNERIIHYTAGQMPLYNTNKDTYNFHGYHQQAGPSTINKPNANVRGTLGRNWRVRTPILMQREYIVDPGPLYASNGYTAPSQLEQQKRHRAKSLDNTNRVNITTLPAKTKRASSKQPEEQNNKSALQSAKSFLRRLYNTSTLRLRGASRNARKMDAAEQRFQMAMAPFYEPRRPDVNERPFLPYNIRYEIEDEEDEGAVYDTHVISTPASSASSATTANNSPDEGIDGMFSANEDSNSSTRSSAVSTNGVSARSPLHNSCLYHHRPGSGLSSSSTANSNFFSAYSNENAYNSPKRQAPILTERFRNWNELFEHLKSEMNEIRARDNKILHDLKKIEEEVNVVKQMA